jgi:hypothetical protein
MDDLRPLDAVEQRVLGALLEKERTVPASYPMTLNALRTACNQSSGRNPVLSLTDAELTQAIDRLKTIGMARMVYASHGARSVKYRQVLDERLVLYDAERAVLTLLLLRGAQTPGELRSRSDRLHNFRDVQQVDVVLDALAARDTPLVQELDRQPGQKEARWIHLLGPVDVAAAPAAGTGAPAESRGGPSSTEGVLREGPQRRTERVKDAYDLVATTYGERVADELDHKPFDRWLLERVAELAGDGPVADIGSGSGQVAYYLAAAGAEVTGFDLSPQMVAEASSRFPEVTFEEADFTALPARTSGEGWGAIAGWYALVHLAASELPPAVAILTAALRPGGWLAIAVHLGDEMRHVTDLFGVPVDVDFTFHRREALLVAFDAAGLTEIEWYERGPIAGVEADTHRLYVLGRRPAG